MDEIKAITGKELQDIAGRTGFNQIFITKDYYVTLILYLLRDTKGLYFKGGTALQKIFLGHSRLSEDVDFTATKDARNDVRKALTSSGFFTDIGKDKDVEGFVHLVAHYKDPFGSKGSVFIDLNNRAKLTLKPENHKVPHFYAGHIPEFMMRTLSRREMAAEKMAAAMARNKPRDHFDLYKLVSGGIPIDLPLVRKKCRSSGIEFDITSMFRKANILKNRWDQDISPLLAEDASFHEVMQTLARHFRYSEAKKEKREREKAARKGRADPPDGL